MTPNSGAIGGAPAPAQNGTINVDTSSYLWGAEVNTREALWVCGGIALLAVPATFLLWRKGNATPTPTTDARASDPTPVLVGAAPGELSNGI